MASRYRIVSTVFLTVVVCQLSSARKVKNEEGITVQYDIDLYKEKNGHRMVQAIHHAKRNGQYEMVDCFIIGDRKVGNELLRELPPERTTTLDKAAMLKKLAECGTLLLAKFRAGQMHMPAKLLVPLSSGVGRGFFDSLVIFPGTKWCGMGNIAEGYDDLGAAADTDMCCRSHDHCNDSISSGSENYGLTNKAIYTKSHCSCDKQFQQCLHIVNSFISNTVGCLYYNTLQAQCFEETHPIVSCSKYSGWIPWIHWSCQEYILDLTKPRIWQFFDAKYYSS